jgi:AhpD family alkylhydroperoxidase
VGSKEQGWGPSIMPGGDLEAYKNVEPILKAVAAKVNEQPCVAYLGNDAAGHYVKMVHNGIEYAVMQLISECYDLLHNGLGLDNDELHKVFADWNLDTNTYEDGAIDKKTKEMLGLVASMVLRCDDCIKYHLGKNHELGVTTEQMYEIFAVANIVGGTIVIPHTRRAAEYWEELNAN